MATSTTTGSPWGNTLMVGYELDGKDRIVGISGAWDQFALDNGAEELTLHRVIGCPLRRYISGDITRMFMETMLAKVRLTGRPFSIAYRCDSPGTKRYMEMGLDLADARGTVQTTHRLVREEPLVPLRVFQTAADAPLAMVQFLKRCSMCNRLTTREGESLEPEALHTDAAGQPIRVIYHVCPDCQARVRAHLAP